MLERAGSVGDAWASRRETRVSHPSEPFIQPYAKLHEDRTPIA